MKSGCETTRANEMANTTPPSNAGTNQFAAFGGECRTSSNTLPGMANTFSSRAASDVGVAAAAGETGGSIMGGGWFKRMVAGDPFANCPAYCLLEWLSDMDSNHDKGLQRALCYHYTIGQTSLKLAVPGPQAKIKLPPIQCAM